MHAITIRQVPDKVHAALKQQAAAHNRSVEAHVRAILAVHADSVSHLTPGAQPMAERPQGFAEAPAPWPSLSQAAPLADLWGALRGTVHVDPATDLAAPLDEPWEAATA